MASLWDDVKNAIVDGYVYASDKAEELSQIGRAKVEILRVNRQIARTMSEIGGRAFDLIEKGEQAAFRRTRRFRERSRHPEDETRHREVGEGDRGGEGRARRGQSREECGFNPESGSPRSNDSTPRMCIGEAGEPKGVSQMNRTSRNLVRRNRTRYGGSHCGCHSDSAV